MNTLQIEAVLVRDACSRRIFRGVYARDQLPTVLAPGGYVINNQSSSKAGEHWLSLYYSENGVREFFDSYAFPPHFYNLEHLIANCNHWMYNEKQLQNPLATTCGQYCVYFHLQRSRGYTMREIVSCFTDNLSSNDRLVSQFVARL